MLFYYTTVNIGECCIIVVSIAPFPWQFPRPNSHHSQGLPGAAHEDHDGRGLRAVGTAGEGQRSQAHQQRGHDGKQKITNTCTVSGTLVFTTVLNLPA